MPCYKPIQIKNPEWRTSVNLKITVPCGYCLGCKLERSRIWAVRCVHENQMHDNSCFVTLTYADENLPWGADKPTLNPRDLQLFMKRLRKRFGNGIRFFACGEYGSNTHRPHYHAILFGIDFPDKKLHGKAKNSDLYVSDILDNLWGLGNCIIGNVTFESAAYVARYIMDKKPNQSYIDQSIEPEFVRMSRKPGIGKPWFDKFSLDIFPQDSVIIRGGIKTKPPRYYSLKYEQLNPEKYLQIKNQRKQRLNEKFDENHPARLLVRETVKKAQITSLKREL